MENTNKVIKTLNEFLQGQYMGIHAYEHVIEKMDNVTIKKELQAIQQEHKQHAAQVAERVQNLGGTPVDSEGIIGSVQGYIGKLMLPETVEDLLKTARKGESYYGIEVSEEIVKGDLDKESKRLIKSILDQDRQHVNKLDNLIKDKGI
jgi:bacterioferritin